MRLAKYTAPALDPWQELEQLRNRVRSFFTGPSRLDAILPEGVSFTPAVEMVETDNEILVTAELPGVSKDQVEVQLEDNVLTLRGEKQEEREQKEKETYLYERTYGSFRRSFTLPAKVDEGKVKAEFADGVLKIHLPKLEKTNGKKIEIA